MIYFANPGPSTVGAMLDDGTGLGLISTPKQGLGTPRSLPAGVRWCADNGCFGSGYVGDLRWLAWLASYSPEQISRCQFATAPDVVGDAAATLERSRPFLPLIAALGYTPAFVAQDGIEDTEIPWDEFGALFVGGSTEFKLGRVAADVVAEAKRRGKWVHMGRVNSARRMRYARLLNGDPALGCDSVDGTYLTFGPDVNLPDVLSWLRHANDQGALA